MQADRRHDEVRESEIADRVAIQHVMARYVHAIDARDYDTLDDVFTVDAAFDMSAAGGICSTWPTVKPWYAENLAAFVDYFHLIENMLIWFDSSDPSGTTARSSSKVINPCGIVGPDGELHHFETVGVWDDTWTKTESGWRINSRIWKHGFVWGDYPFARMPGDFQ
jgi:hypothetical protein